MNAYPYSQEPDNTPAASFQKLCQVMLDGSSKNLNKKNVEDFRVILHIIMRECSKANIESGKTWVFDHCQTPVHAAVLMEYILALSKSRTGPEDRIHMIYLLNDILFHTARKQMTWMRDAMLPLLVPLLKLAYNAAQNPEQQAKIVKVITFWGDKQVFESSIISSIKRDVVGNNYADQQQQNRTLIDPQTYRQNQQQMSYQQQPPPPTTMQPAMFRPQPPHHRSSPYTAPQYQPPPKTPGQQNSSQLPYQQSSHTSPTSSPAVSYKQYTNPMHHPKPAPGNQFQQINPPPSTVLPPTPPQKPYHQLPAGLMLLTKSENYSPIDPSDIKVPFPRPLPTKEIAEAVEEFYKGLDLSNSDDVLLDDKNESRIDAQGWEKGYLDRYMNAAAQRKIDAIARQEQYKRRSTSREERRGRSPPRGNVRQSRSRSPGYHHRRSYSRSRSRSPPHGRRISPNRGRSPPRRRERTPPRRGRSPSGYNRRRYSRSLSRSPPPYSSNAYYGSNNSGNMNYDPPASTENRYMGLGSNSKADEFDSFRKSRSQAYSKRESYQPFMCYKCNKPGHLARECNSL